MNWFIFWLVIYFIVIGYFIIKHVKHGDIESYLVNNRSTKTIPLVFTILATFVGGGVSMGLMAFGYEAGFTAVGIGLAYVIGFFILSRYAAGIYRSGVKFNIYSFPEFLNRNYTKDASPAFSKLFSTIVSTVNIFIFFFLLSAQFVAMASLIEFTFEVGYLYAAIISCLVVIIYTAVAGLSGVIVTDFIQFIVIIILIIVIFIPGILSDTVGLTKLSELPRDFLTATHEGVIFLIALPIFLAPSVLVRMDIWQRILAANSEKVARKVSIISGLGMLPFYIIFPLVGMAVKITNTPIVNSKDVTYSFLSQHCSSEFVLGFAVIGLLSALMSSGDSFLNLISITVIKDFVGWRKKKSTVLKGTIQKNIRYAVIVFGIIALFISLVMPNLVDLMVVGIATIVIFVPVTFLALMRKDVHKYRIPAIVSIISGFVVNVAFFTYGTIYPDDQISSKSSFIPAFIIALITLIIGIWLNNKKEYQMKFDEIKKSDLTEKIN